MERAVEQLRVYTENGKIQVAQEDVLQQESHYVTISPDQVDQLIAWLKEAQAALAVDAATSRR